MSQRFYSANAIPGGADVWSAFISGINGATLSIALQSGGTPNSFSELQDGSFSLIVF